MEQVLEVATSISCTVDRPSDDWCLKVAERYRTNGTKSVRNHEDHDLTADMFNAVGALSDRDLSLDVIAKTFGTHRTWIADILRTYRAMIPETRALVDSRIPCDQRLNVTDARYICKLPAKQQMEGARNLLKARHLPRRRYSEMASST